MAGLEPTNARVKVWCLTDLATSQHVPQVGKMGWVAGFEPATPRATIWYSNQLSYTHHIVITLNSGTSFFIMARLKGLEPLTHCLEGSCSIHLSYRRIWSG